MITQSDSAEDSQGRQLRVNKKLSKAISSVPRSRFQKPRPNLPGSKRPDSSSATVGARKTVGTPQNRRDSNASELKINETPQNRRESNASESKINEIVPSGDNIESALLKSDLPLKNYTSEKLENENITGSVSFCISGIIENTEELPVTVISVDEVDNTEKLSTENTFEEEPKNTILSTEETLHTIDDKNTTALNIGATSAEQNGFSSVLNTKALLEKENEESAVTKKAVKENIVSSTNEKATEEECIVLSNAQNPLPNPPEQERSDTVNISSSVTDRSSKYPHLTSILLSKKRTEPKKEVQHKRRKKFRKGDVAPERSKMTMADLIYWNPTNTNECTAKSSTIVEEVSSITTVAEEEYIDGDVEENNICDSVPKLVISEDGQINIDQTSLIVSRSVPKPIVTEVVGKDETTYSSFRKRPLTKHWSPKDTTIFYKALSLVGTDFGLMEKIFPHRTRRELKQKFKREEKYNIDLINRAMYESQLTFDADTLEDLIEHLNNISDNSENADDFRPPAKAAKKKSFNGKKKRTRKTKNADTEINDSLTDSATESLPNEALNKREVSNKRKRKTKKLPEDFLDVDDIENSLLDSEEAINNVNEKEKNNKKRKREKTLPSDSDTVVSDNVNEKEKNNKKRKREKTLPSDSDTVVSDNEELLEVHVTSSVENSQNEDESCIPTEYIEDISSVTDSTLLSNVMAFEVVTSQTPETKKKNNKKQTVIPLVLSSMNYTPS